jgi:N-acetylmuramoyl-L-alanine amidase
LVVVLVVGVVLRGSLTRITKTAISNAVSAPRTNTPKAIDPSYFASGACMSYPPTSGDRHTTVFLDAGHGGLDPGGVGVTESGQQFEESTIHRRAIAQPFGLA